MRKELIEFLTIQAPSRLNPQSKTIVYISNRVENFISYMQNRSDKKQWIPVDKVRTFKNYNTGEEIRYCNVGSMLSGLDFKAYIIDPDLLIV